MRLMKAMLGSLAVLVALTQVVLACSKDEPVQQGEVVDEEWFTLIQADWTLPVGKEGYTCALATVPEDMYIRGFQPIAPPGTHHTLFTFGETSGSAPDEVFPCDAAANEQYMLFGSGVGTDPVEFPPGVAMKLTKGSRMMLNLHLFNVTDAPLGGRSGVQVRRVAPKNVVHEAEIVLAGKLAGLTVAPGVTKQTGSCDMAHDVTLFAVFPHMHQLGTHLKATAEPVAGEPRVLIDTPYSFEDQLYYPVNPMLTLKAGDKVSVECEYTNPGADTIGFGDSSLAEMCFTGLFRYPKGAERFICASFGDGGRPILDGPACVDAGAPGNENGVGKHCTNRGGECGGRDAGPGARLCLADYTDGAFGNFCTMQCSDDASCGTGARCLGSGFKTCIPNGCELNVNDGGLPEGGSL